MRHLTRRLVAMLLAIAALAAACGNSDKPDRDTSDSTSRYSAEAGSFDLADDSPQRFLLGLTGPNQESVAYGKVTIDFVFDGPKGHPLARPRRGPTATARFVNVPGQHIDPTKTGPRLVEASEARGVYKTDPIAFDSAGFWEANARFRVDGQDQSVSAAFEVLEHHQLPFVGDPAPRTTQALAGDASVPAKAIDSRALDGDPIPDPELHDTTIAAALDAHRPLMVVVATPTYCTSRFCGPITDAVARLAGRYRDQMTFVHLEIWADFDNGKLNPWVNDWVIPRNGEDGREPWVFVVNRAGIISARFDNLANDAELDAAARDVIGS